MPSFPIYGIADLHLGLSSGQTMDKYGGQWVGHNNRLLDNWIQTVEDDGIVLVPGDISASREKDEILEDYIIIDALPGRKILSPGNHDASSVWVSHSKVTRLLESYSSLTPLKAQATRIAVGDGPGVVIAATCGSLLPGTEYFLSSEHNHHRFVKEEKRIVMALERAKEVTLPGDKLIVMIHYPPFERLVHDSVYTNAIEQAGADLCVFGHIHTQGEHTDVFQGMRNGCEYKLISSDYLKMMPTLLGHIDENGLTLS